MSLAERQFVVPNNEVLCQLLMGHKPFKPHICSVEQFYTEYKYTKISYKGRNNEYTKLQKGKNALQSIDITRHEYEIACKVFKSSNPGVLPLKKKRTAFVYGLLIVTIDEFLPPFNTIIMYINTFKTGTDLASYKPPVELVEVTGDMAYKTKNIFYKLYGNAES